VSGAFLFLLVSNFTLHRHEAEARENRHRKDVEEVRQGTQTVVKSMEEYIRQLEEQIKSLVTGNNLGMDSSKTDGAEISKQLKKAHNIKVCQDSYFPIY